MKKNKIIKAERRPKYFMQTLKLLINSPLKTRAVKKR